MIPLAVPNLTGNEKKYLNECIDTTFVSSVGEFVTRFEKGVAKAAGASYATATSCGTTALHMALVTMGVKRDDLVIMPTFTFIATANAVSHIGAVPWLFDIEEETLTLDADLVESALCMDTEKRPEGVFHKLTGRRVAAIVPVYTLGTPADMKRFKEMSDQYGIPLVADAAAALGASYRGENIGELADLTALSFNGNKTITCGGGGMIIGRDKEMIMHAKHISTTARCGVEYEHDEVGYNYRMTNIQAAVGVAQLERLDEFVAKKRYIRDFYIKRLSDAKGIRFVKDPVWGQSACWFSAVILEDSELPSVKELCEALREKGIEARTFWKPVHVQKPYEKAVRCKTFQIADRLFDRILTLPCSTGISDVELETVAECVGKLLRR